ncbi:hypothetical protein GF354_04625 [Candidatus Peregrinibacteria bacterium]|nr:hypothetical protein [Candidatus Peregrinibacteria bacterium]
MINNDEHGSIGGNGRYPWLRDFVYGGIDGAVTTFAVVAGVEGAALNLPIILILGFANLFADGFSMASGKYLSDKAQCELQEKIRKIEFKHIKEKEEEEREEVRQIVKKYGFKGKDLEKATQIITSNPEAWVDLMMRNEFNMTSENISPMKGALTTFTSFFIIGLIPLLAYLFRPLFGLEQKSTFIITCTTTLLALFLVGTVKSFFTVKSWYRSGMEVLIIGGLAAAISYLIGFLLKFLYYSAAAT